MALFQEDNAPPAYLKASFYGELGTGKTHTASLLAIGLANKIQQASGAKPPVYFFDTEVGSKWVAPLFKQAGVNLLVVKSRTFKVLLEALAEAEQAGAILICDSVTHLWEEAQSAFLAEKRRQRRDPRARLEISDWNVIKREWAKFTAAFVASDMHIILCGRAASIFEMQERDDDSGRKEMIATGTKMAAEKGLGYEPNLVVEMSAYERKLAGGKKEVAYLAFIKKDRSRSINGQYFTNPTYADLRPHIDFLHIGGAGAGLDLDSNSRELFDQGSSENRALRREILLGNIKQLITIHIPGRTADDQRRKELLLRKHFKAAWPEIERKASLETLQDGHASLQEELEGIPPDNESVDAPLGEQPPANAQPAAAPSPEPAQGMDVLEAGPVTGEPASSGEPVRKEDNPILTAAAFAQGQRDRKRGLTKNMPPPEYAGNQEAVQAYRRGLAGKS